MVIPLTYQDKLILDTEVTLDTYSEIDKFASTAGCSRRRRYFRRTRRSRPAVEGIFVSGLILGVSF